MNAVWQGLSVNMRGGKQWNGIVRIRAQDVSSNSEALPQLMKILHGALLRQ
jgi:hypothetical protein